MRIEIIDSYEKLIDLKPHWNAVYEKDPEAQFFLSWNWLSNWLDDDDDQWFVLAARSDTDPADYVGFLPLRLSTRMRRKGGFYNEISFAGGKLSDYAGFICVPEHLTVVICAFARHLKRSNWTCLKMECLCASQERIDLLLDHFPRKKFKISDISDISKRDKVDNLICPAVSLPQDWESYLSSLSSSNGQKARRFLRMIETSDEFSIRLADADSIENDLTMLLDFWKAELDQRKGGSLQTTLRANFLMLKRSFECGALFLPVLHHNGHPLAALASFIDPVKRSLLCFIEGSNND
ncbi:MAG: GNAT family N-acetyltransferase, partial [Aestuariivirgaceae bacterium]